MLKEILAPRWSWVDDAQLIADRTRSRHILEATERWQANSGNLTLIGSTRLGKSACLVRMLRRWVRTAREAATFQQLQERLIYTSQLEIDSDDLLARRARVCDVLVLDDLHRVPGEHAFSRDVLDDRLRRPERTTLLASCVPLSELTRGLGVSLFPVIQDWTWRWSADRESVASTAEEVAADAALFRDDTIDVPAEFDFDEAKVDGL